MYGNSSYKPSSLEAGAPVVKEVDPIIWFCFATEILGWEDFHYVTRMNLGGWRGKGKCRQAIILAH